MDHVPGVQGELVPGDIEALVGARSVAGVPSWFTLTQSRRQFAAACGVVAAEQVWQGFLDHWVNDRKAGVTVDWDARWRTWVRNEVKWHGKRTDRLRPSGQVHDLLDHLPRVPGRRGGSR